MEIYIAGDYNERECDSCYSHRSGVFIVFETGKSICRECIEKVEVELKVIQYRES